MPPETPPARPPPSKATVFLRRLLTSIVLWTIVISALFSSNKVISNGVFLLIMVTLAGLGSVEFYRLVERRGLVCYNEWGIFGGLLFDREHLRVPLRSVGHEGSASQGQRFRDQSDHSFRAGPVRPAVCLAQQHRGHPGDLEAVEIQIAMLEQLQLLVVFIQLHHQISALARGKRLKRTEFPWSKDCDACDRAGLIELHLEAEVPPSVPYREEA